MSEILQFNEVEIITIENLFVELIQMISNDNGEIQKYYKKIINTENILSAKLDHLHQRVWIKVLSN